jgi:hypothetical protein
MKEPTIKEILELVDFERDTHGVLRIKTVKNTVWGDVGSNVLGNVVGSVYGDVEGDVKSNVGGTINGREWQFVETPKEKAIRLIRNGEIEEAIKILEEGE